MEPNNLENGQPMVPEQSVVPEQPVAPELPNIIPMEPQPAVPEVPKVPKKEMDPLTKNTIVFCLVVGAVIVFGIVGIILTLVLGAGKHNNSGSNPNTPINPPVAENVPSMELAEKVCKKYDGKFINIDEARFGAGGYSDEYFSVEKVCERYTYIDVDPSVYRDSSHHMDGTPLTDQEIQEMYGVSIGPTDFSYSIGVIRDGKKEEFWETQREYIINDKASGDISSYIILEDSDEFIKACKSVAGLQLGCVGLYDDIVISVMTGDIDVMDEIFAELGFPDRATLAKYAESRSSNN
ncbi:hypothetical protein IKF84_00725 [Candidatus Saccharibacteria bacterium]|nr:hypothetical protein [Candidatus Saccharibacteria bacterium]